MLAFSGQNAGALRFDRIKKICAECLAMVFVLGAILGGACYLLGPQLLSLFGVEGTVETSEAMRVGMLRLLIVGAPYCLCGMMEVMSGMLRGLGASLVSAIVSLVGSCLLRVIWIYTVFEAYHTLPVLYLSYPVTWIITGVMQLVLCLVIKRRIQRRAERNEERIPV